MFTLKEKQQEKEHKLKDIDEIIISDEEQHKRFDSVIQWLNSLKPVFSEYSLGGYTSNENIKNLYNLRLYKEGNHFRSCHLLASNVEGFAIRENNETNSKIKFHL